MEKSQSDKNMCRACLMPVRMANEIQEMNSQSDRVRKLYNVVIK